MNGVTTTEFITAIVATGIGLLLIRRGAHLIGILFIVIASLAISASAPAQYVDHKVNSLVAVLVS